MSEDKKEGSSVYTEAKDCVKEGNTAHTIEVKRAVRDVDERKSVESTVITEEIQRKKENTSVFDYTGTRHNVSGGTSTEHVARETTEISRRDGTPKVIIEEKERSLTREDGTMAQSAGYDYEITTFQTSQTEDRYDRNGRLKSSEVHSETVSKDEAFKIDEKAKYKYDYKGEGDTEYSIGDSERYETKRVMSAYAHFRNGAVELQVKSSGNKREFEGHINSDGSEVYSTTKRGKVVEVRATEDEVMGVKYDLSTGEESALSKRRLKRELKNDRKKADGVIEEVTNGEIEAVDEYMYGIRGAEVTGEVPVASYMFDMTPEQIENGLSASEEDMAKHRAEVEKAKSITAEDIVRQRLAESRAR